MQRDKKEEAEFSKMVGRPVSSLKNYSTIIFLENSEDCQLSIVHHNNPENSVENILDSASVNSITSQHMPDRTDIHQRQPLLLYDNNTTNHWDCVREQQIETAESCNGLIRITIPTPLREEVKFPKEKLKTLVSFLFAFCSCIFNMLSLAIIHDRVPDRTKYPPLPDIILDNINAQDWGLDVSEYLIMVSLYSCILLMLLHRYRWILFRRIFFLMGLLYLMRSVTMFVTVLPIASTTYYCSPQANTTSITIVIQRVWQLFTGFGLSVNGHHIYCGDYLYSGHTVVLTMTYLIFQEYTPCNFVLLHWLVWCSSVFGVCMLLYARGHYTVDVIVAYYVTTRLFWTYHTIANNSVLKTKNSQNLISRVWWYFIFHYFENNVSGTVPRQYDWPLPWPSSFHRKQPGRHS